MNTSCKLKIYLLHDEFGYFKSAIRGVKGFKGAYEDFKGFYGASMGLYGF